MSKQKSVQFKKSALMGCQIIFQYFETFYRAYHHIETFYCDDTRCSSPKFFSVDNKIIKDKVVKKLSK